MSRSVSFKFGATVLAVGCGAFFLGRYSVDVDSLAKGGADETLASESRNSQRADGLIDEESVRARVGAIADGFGEGLANGDLLEENEEANVSWRGFLEGMTAEEAPVIFEELMMMEVGPRRASMMRRFFARWGELDGPLAFEGAKVMSGRARMTMMSEVAGGWAKADPMAAWDTLMNASNFGAVKSVSLLPAMEVIIENNPNLASELVNGAGSENVRESYLKALIGVARTDGDYASAYQSLQSVDGMNGNLEYTSRLFQDWGRRDFDGAMDVLSRIPDERLMAASMAGAMRGWAYSDAYGAFEYVLANSDDPLVGRNLKSVASILARSATAEEMTVLFDSISDSSQRERLASVVVPELAKADPEYAMAWAMDLESGKTRVKSVQSVMKVWVQEDYDGMKDMLRHGNLDGDMQRSAFYALASEARNMRGGAAELVDLAGSMSDADSRKRVISQLAQIGGSKGNGRGSVNRRALQEAVLSSREFSQEEKDTFLKKSESKDKGKNSNKPQNRKKSQ